MLRGRRKAAFYIQMRVRSGRNGQRLLMSIRSSVVAFVLPPVYSSLPSTNNAGSDEFLTLENGEIIRETIGKHVVLFYLRP